MMKKILFTTCFLSFLATVSMAQEWSFRLGLGYAFPTASQTLDASGLPYSGNVTYTSANTGDIQSIGMKKASFGSGFKAVGGIQYMFTKNIGIAADINLGVTTPKYVLQTTNDVSVNKNEVSDNTYTRYAELPVLLIPSFVLQSGGDKVNVYARAGIALPLSTQIISEEHDNYQNVAGDEEQLNKTVKTQFNLGFSGALGLSYRVSENFSFWVEGNLVALSVYPKEAEITVHTINGTATTAPPATGGKVSYVTSGTPSSNYDNVSFSIPFSSVGFLVGASYNLGKRKTVHTQE